MEFSELRWGYFSGLGSSEFLLLLVPLAEKATWESSHFDSSEAGHLNATVPVGDIGPTQLLFAQLQFIFDVLNQSLLSFVAIGQDQKAIHFVAFVSLRLGKKFLDFLYEVVAVAGDNRESSFPSFPDDFGIRGVWWESNIGNGPGPLLGEEGGSLGNVPVEQETVRIHSVFSFLTHESTYTPVTGTIASLGAGPRTHAQSRTLLRIQGRRSGDVELE